jgi:hypothetical protein
VICEIRRKTVNIPRQQTATLTRRFDPHGSCNLLPVGGEMKGTGGESLFPIIEALCSQFDVLLQRAADSPAAPLLPLRTLQN